MKKALFAIPEMMQKDKVTAEAENQKKFTHIQASVIKATANSQESVAAISKLKNRVEDVKKDSTSGVVLSIVVFSTLLIISLFIRASG